MGNIRNRSGVIEGNEGIYIYGKPPQRIRNRPQNIGTCGKIIFICEIVRFQVRVAQPLKVFNRDWMLWITDSALLLKDSESPGYFPSRKRREEAKVIETGDGKEDWRGASTSVPKVSFEV